MVDTAMNKAAQEVINNPAKGELRCVGCGKLIEMGSPQGGSIKFIQTFEETLMYHKTPCYGKAKANLKHNG